METYGITNFAVNIKAFYNLHARPQSPTIFTHKLTTTHIKCVNNCYPHNNQTTLTTDNHHRFFAAWHLASGWCYHHNRYSQMEPNYKHLQSWWLSWSWSSGGGTSDKLGRMVPAVRYPATLGAVGPVTMEKQTRTSQLYDILTATGSVLQIDCTLVSLGPTGVEENKIETSQTCNVLTAARNLVKQINCRSAWSNSVYI